MASDRALFDDLDANAVDVLDYLCGRRPDSAVFAQMKADYHNSRSNAMASDALSSFNFDSEILHDFNWIHVPYH